MFALSVFEDDPTRLSYVIRKGGLGPSQIHLTADLKEDEGNLSNPEAPELVRRMLPRNVGYTIGNLFPYDESVDS